MRAQQQAHRAEVQAKAALEGSAGMRFGGEKGHILHVAIGAGAEEQNCFYSGDRVWLDLKAQIAPDVKRPRLAIVVRDLRGYNLFAFNTAFAGAALKPDDNGIVGGRFSFDCALQAGDYSVTVRVEDYISETANALLDKQIGAVTFKVLTRGKKFEGVVDLAGAFEPMASDGALASPADEASRADGASPAASATLVEGVSAAAGSANRRSTRSSSAGLCLPDFLGIGAQKAGTSWLWENLRRHPGAFLPEVKEVQFFSQNFDRGPDWYSTVFEPGRGKIKGDVTPAYGVLPAERIAAVKDLLPEAKLILLLRNPIDRAWSHAVMNLITQPGRPPEEVSEDEFFRHFTSDASRSRGDYESILDRWLAAYPATRLFIGFFEDIADRPKGLLTDIFNHLCLPTDIDWSTIPFARRVFNGPGLEMPARCRAMLQTIYAPAIGRLSRRLGAPARKWLEPAERAEAATCRDSAPPLDSPAPSVGAAPLQLKPATPPPPILELPAHADAMP
jgi:hypothetical protein